MLSLRRQFSQLLKKDPSAITVELVRSHKPKEDHKKERVALIHAINESANDQKSALFKELIPDFSLYFDLKNGKLSNEIVSRLIEVNPERVYSDFELFKGIEEPSELLLETFLKKLIVKTAEEEHRIQSLRQISSLLKQYSPSEDTFQAFFDILVENDAFLVELVPWPQDFLLKNLSRTNGLTYLNIISSVLEESTTDDTTKALKIINMLDLTEEFNKEALLKAELNFSPEPLDINSLLHRILSKVESGNLDTAVDALPLRIYVVETYGIHLSDIEKALLKFNRYQTHNKEDIDLVQQTLLKCFVYQSILQNDKKLLRVADTLVEDLTIRTLQLLMIGQANFSSEDSLALYNDYIKDVSKKINTETKRSSSGLLTETLMLGCLYDNDREFAQLLLEKAVQNGIVSDEFEISHLKKLFRVYGDAFEGSDETWASARAFLKKFVLGYVKAL